MSTRITVDQLEKMTTHEVADLLSSMVLLLRRMPNVECSQLTGQPNKDDIFIEKAPVVQVQQPVASFTVADLKGKNLTQLKQLAKSVNLPFLSNIKKDDLLSKLTKKLAHEHSEQYAIQDI